MASINPDDFLPGSYSELALFPGMPPLPLPIFEEAPGFPEDPLLTHLRIMRSSRNWNYPSV